jgi:hypothetical protein
VSNYVCKAVSSILGKDITGFKRLAIDSTGRVLLTGKTANGHGYSEFHFGAGESSVIRMVSGIELTNEQALVLIEEIENGLHPVATVRLVEYLIEASRGALYLILQNQLYRGEISHKGNSYPGEHPAIVDKPLWDDVQAVLAANRVERATGARGRHPSLLTGMVFDEAGAEWAQV